MNNRLIVFIIMVVLATLTAFAQEVSTVTRIIPNEQVISETVRDMSMPVVIAEKPPIVVSETVRDMSEPVAAKETIVSETVRDLTLPIPPVMEEPKPISAPTIPAEATNGNNGVNIGLSAEVRQKEASLLNKLLADEFVLYTKTLKFHWNVQGIVFHDFHNLFKDQYEKLFDIVDSIAERARSLGAPALGSLQEFTTYTRLKEITTEKLSALEMIKGLLLDHEAIIRTIREAIDTAAQLGDQGTSNFLQDLIIKHEKLAWMLRATDQN